MKKVLFFAAMALVTLASCSDETFVGDVTTAPQDNSPSETNAIVFSSASKGITRADFTGKDAAEKLGSKFVVTGFKGSLTASVGSIVFDNYLVEYAANTSHTTESNTNNWEYVGKGVIKHATDKGITQQTIKYWDYSVSQYDFIAWSTGSKTAIYEKENSAIPAGKVLVSAIIPQAATSPASGLGTAYTFEGEAEDLKECYIADLMTVYKGAAGGTYNVVSNGYQQPVTLKFRQLGTKVRIGIYETVPGYSVKNVQFYSAAASDDASAAAAKIFTTVANGIYKEGKYTVTFPTVDDPTNADNNQAHVEFTPAGTDKQKTTVDWGALKYTYRESGEKETGAVYLGRTSNTASFAGDAANNYYVVYLPNQNGTNLNLRVNYTLESIDGSGETITVKGATAQVPSIYTAWKPGYAYTYLFKISDKTNGYTGAYNPLYPDDVTINSDPAGLYPITFDAVVVNAEEDATQETITTISTPSITTYQKGSTVVNANEYKATGDIFVTVNDGETSYKLVTGLTTGTSSVAGYYTKETQDVYTPASGTADGTTSYYEYDGGTSSYTEVTPKPTSGTDVSSYYTKGTQDVYTPATGTAVANTEYYRMVTTVESGKLVTLVKNNSAISVANQANLFTLPADKAYTEADVVDALQLQDDDATSGTIKGRSGLVLTPATFSLVDQIQYGVDGNAISVGTNQAAQFTPSAGTYAFVYTKTAATGSPTPIYQPITKTAGQTVGANVYRYAYKNATCTNDKGTNTEDDDIYDAQKGVKYFSLDAGVYKVETAFIGQDVSNAYILKDGKYVLASGYAVTGTDYYYTTNNGISYTKAHNEAYAQFEADVTDEKIYTYNGTTYTKVTGITTPAANTAYYYLDTDSKYYWCIFLPQQTKGWYEIDETADKVLCGTTEKAIDGQTYFDKYTKNDGVYYTKIIKVQ